MEVITRHNQTHDAQALSDGSGDQTEGAAGQANGSMTPPTPMDLDHQEFTTSDSASSSNSLEKAKARVGFAVQLVNRALRGGEGPVLAAILIRLLPSLIRIQVLSSALAVVFRFIFGKWRSLECSPLCRLLRVPHAAHALSTMLRTVDIRYRRILC